MVGAVVADARARREHRLRGLAEGDRDDPGALGHPLAGAQVERHAGPAPVVDEALQRDEGLGLGVVRARRARRGSRCTGPRTTSLGWIGCIERKTLFFSRLIAAGSSEVGRLHRGEREDLEQVGDDHVAVGAGRLVEVTALGQAEGLGHVDLDVGDVVPVPDRLEQAVGEAEGQDVLRRLLAEEVVDPEDLLLLEHLVQLGVERDGRGVVGAERLLHDDPAALDEAGLGDGAHGGERGLGRHRQVVQPLVDLAGQQRLGPADGLAQGQRARPRGARSRAAARTRASRRRPSRGCCARGWRPWPGRGRRRGVSSSSEVPTTRRSSTSPDWKRCSRPGMSLRLARSPVAPKRTKVVGAVMGPACRPRGPHATPRVARPRSMVGTSPLAHRRTGPER